MCLLLEQVSCMFLFLFFFFIPFLKNFSAGFLYIPVSLCSLAVLEDFVDQQADLKFRDLPAFLPSAGDKILRLHHPAVSGILISV